MRKLNVTLQIRGVAGGFEISKTGDYEDYNGKIVLGYDEATKLMVLLKVCLDTGATSVLTNTKIEDDA